MSNVVECSVKVFGHKTSRKKFERIVKTSFERFSFDCITPKEADFKWRIINLGLPENPKKVKLKSSDSCHEYIFETEYVAPILALKALSRVFEDLIFDLEFTCSEYDGRFIYMKGEAFEEDLQDKTERVA